MDDSIDSSLVLSALSMAALHRQPPSGLIFYSDRGVQYAARNFRNALASLGLIASMSRRGNCYDNAAMESFWSTLKNELVYGRDVDSHREAKTEIFNYIEVFYNRLRIHTSWAACPLHLSYSKIINHTSSVYYPLFRSSPTDRSGRREPRAVKRRPKPYARLNKPRRLYTVTPHRNRFWKNNPRKSRA